MTRYTQSKDANPTAQHTLEETERAIAERLSGMAVDMPAMAAVSNIYRAGGAVRNHLERTVLAPYDLTWTSWVVLWVVWIWGDIESRHVAAEAGISKATLTGVTSRLQSRKLMKRRIHPDDARRVLLSLTPSGRTMMGKLFPEFNRAESYVIADLSATERQVLARALRKIVLHLEEA
ncbi:MAG: MarR family winged helix-turn-helix transcriptional regulator [Nocardioides sp.]